MCQNSNFLTQINNNIVRVESVFWINMCNSLSNKGESIIVWDCRNWQGVGNLCFIKKKMDKYVYREILEIELINTIHMYDLGVENFIFQQKMTLNILLSILQIPS